MQHCPPVTFNIFGCYMLGPFAHPVACCCWHRSNFKAPCKRTQNCNCWPTAPNIVGCYMLGPFAHRVACCCVLLRVVVQCWIRLPNIVGATHAHYTWSAWSLPSLIGVYPSNDALQVPTLFGVVASVCTPLLKQTQQFPTVLRPFFDLNRSPLLKCVCVCVWGGEVTFQLSKASKKWLSCSSRPKKGFALGVAVYRKWHPLCLANYKWGLAGSGYSYRCCSWGDGCGSNIGLSKHKQLGFLFFIYLFPQFNVGWTAQLKRNRLILFFNLVFNNFLRCLVVSIVVASVIWKLGGFDVVIKQVKY